MSQVCVMLLVLFQFISVYGYPRENVMYMPPLEVRTVDTFPFASQFQENRRLPKQQRILHTNLEQKPREEFVSHSSTDNITISDIIEALNGGTVIQQNEKSPQLRDSAYLGRDSNDSAYSTYPRPYPQQNSMGYGSTPGYQKPSPIAVPSAPVLPKIAPLKPDLSTLFKPVTTKVSSKVSGLLGLILALFSGSSSSGLQMDGLKDLVINGIVKPLLVAKGGIKTLISKLTIPLISLLLINLEVLITVWWLWDDCEVQKPTAPTYSYSKPAYNYNNYNSYR